MSAAFVVHSRCACEAAVFTIARRRASSQLSPSIDAFKLAVKAVRGVSGVRGSGKCDSSLYCSMPPLRGTTLKVRSICRANASKALSANEKAFGPARQTTASVKALDVARVTETVHDRRESSLKTLRKRVGELYIQGVPAESQTDIGA